MAKFEPTEAQIAHAALVNKYVRPGDVLTHTRCMGHIEEHVFTGERSGTTGHWLCGEPTADTIKFDAMEKEVDEDGEFYHSADDISPYNVTHINRDDVDAIPALIEIDPKWRQRR